MNRPADDEQIEADEEGAASAEVARSRPEGASLTIAGIGASAGGLAALQSFFDALPPDTGIAFVVVTHMDPEGESMLPDLLQRHTTMPVRQVTARTPIEAGHIYVIPPGQGIVVTNTDLDVEAFEQPVGRRTPVDNFFRSLAAAHRDAVAIILSGGGTDGAVGVKEVKEKGGLLMVQEPDEAEYGSMPRAAVATGLADVVLPVRELAQKLAGYQQNSVQLAMDPEALTESERNTLYRILAVVHTQNGHDFSRYKRSTLLRRILRRMQIHGYDRLDAYHVYLRQTPDEARLLFNDLLVGVTNFFRDPSAWQTLAEKVVPRLFEGKGQGDAVRAWSIGCSTGEEAYTLAILLLEQWHTLKTLPAVRPQLQVFASDLDEEALHSAREGLYPEVIEADVSPERLARFFVKDGHHYQLRRELRDIVLFSNHSVLRDPPFSRLDLISCRNLLIYLNRDLQENVFHIFHYALAADRYLFLGSAESAEMVHQLFRTVDEGARLYQARPWQGQQRHVPSLPLGAPGPQPEPFASLPGISRFRKGEAHAAGSHHLRQLEEGAPASVLVDETFKVLHLSKTAGRYLHLPGGPLSGDLLMLVRPELQSELRMALSQAFIQRKAVISRPVAVNFNGGSRDRRLVILAVRPSTRAGATGETSAMPPSEQTALVFFLEDERAEAAGEAGPLEGVGGTESDGARQLEAEVRRLRAELEASVEEQASANEELRAANEELQSINEEYRSTTEELETSKEELQSVNEELHTVNAELKSKLEETARAHNDLENLMISTDIATLFLDPELRIQRYTPGVAGLFNIMPADRGRPIAHLTNKLDYDALPRDAAQVLKTLVPIEREIQAVRDGDVQGDWFLARLRPYRTIDDRIDGVVLTFVDITELKETERALRRNEERLRKILQIRTVGVIFFDESGQIVDANEAFLEQIGYTRAELKEGEISWQALTPAEWMDESDKQMERLVETGHIGPYEKQYVGKDGSRRWFLFVGTRLEDGTVVEFCIAIDEQKKAQAALAESERRYRALAESLEERVEERTAELRESERRFRSLIDASASMVWTTDAHGRAVEDSPSWRAYTGQSLEEWLDEGWIDVVHPEDREAAGREWRDNVEAQVPVNHEHRIYHAPSGEWRWTNVRAVPLYDERGAVIGWIGMNIDIDEQKRAEQEVRALATRLSLAEQEERDRVARILHDDLQQQLYAVQLQLSMLQAAHEEKDDAAFSSQLAEMSAELDEALHTTRQLNVDLSPPILRDEGLTEAFGWLATRMKEQQQLQVTVEAHRSFPVPDEGLRVLLFQAVRELLFNVVKHSGTHEATVQLEQADDHVRITVHDGGKGFDRDAVLGEKRQGSGLSTLQHRLSLVDGELEIKSAPGDGTRVSVVAPLRMGQIGD